MRGVRCPMGNNRTHIMERRPLFSLLAVLPLLVLHPLHAQEAQEQPLRTLISADRPVHSGGWGGPTASFTRVLDQDAMLVGLRGGWIIDHHFTIGLAGHGLVTPVRNAAYDAHLQDLGRDLRHRSRFQLGYGGLLLEPVIAPASPVHVSLPVLIGAGGCGYQTFTGEFMDIDPETWEDDVQAFFVVEPGIELEVSLVRLVRIGLGASYRYTSDILLPATERDALNGFNATFAVKVGVF